MPLPLKYETLEKLDIGPPVERVSFISELCRDKVVLDIGCLDETAFIKRDTEHWLHGRIATVAQRVIGIDNSPQIPSDGLQTSASAVIVKGDGIDPVLDKATENQIGIIVAGEFIEHLDSPLAFLRSMKRRFPGRELVISTPNGASFANALLGLIGREAQHPDHLLTSTYKTLNTMCLRTGFSAWQIVPYRFFATEMLLTSSGLKALVIRLIERAIRTAERIFPLRSFGYIVHITL